MRLNRLDISGFKSFAKKTELVFGSGITAVIGPNGSGKSNISDAVRWVLGEQSARALRGSKMEDVIFNGTQKRKPQSMCEVTLTFDNTDHLLPTDYDEVAVTRRMFRSGESEYVLNGRNCRLKDISELFRDTGIGKDGYSIISQGRVDEILSNKSGDRRTALEEAAGVMRYRVRKEEAERKLDNTERNMERIADTLKELGERLEPLKEQSATARAYLKLREELKDLEVNLFLYNSDRMRERMKTIAEQTAALVTEIELNETQNRTLGEQSLELEAQVREIDERASAQQNKVIEMLSGVESHVGESNLLMERREHAKKEIARVGEERDAAIRACEELKTQIAANEQGDTNVAELAELTEEILRETDAIRETDADIAAREANVEAEKAAVMDAMNRLADARSDLSRFDTMAAALKDRLAALDGEDTEAKARVDALKTESETAKQAEAAQAGKMNEHVAARKTAQRERMEMESDFLALQAELRINEQNVGALSSREHVLREMVRSHEGYQNSVRAVLTAAETNAELEGCIVGPVAELLKVPKKVETAIGMSLGGSLQNIVTNNAEDAKTVIEYARKNDLGRVTLLPISLLNPNPLTEKERALLKEPGVVGLASELVRCDKQIGIVAEYLLGRTVVTETLDDAIALRKKSHSAFHIATLLGDFLSTGGTMTGGSLKKSGFSLLGREREVEEIQKQLKAAQTAVEKKQQAIEAQKKQMLLKDTQIDAFLSAAHEDELELVRLKEQREIIDRDLREAEEAVQELIDERGDVNESIADIEKRRASAASVEDDIRRKNLLSAEDIRKEQAAIASDKQRREERVASLTERRIRLTALEKEADARKAEHHRLSRELALTEQRVGSFEAEIRTLAESVEQANARITEMEQSISGEQDALNRAKEEQSKLEAERARINELLSQYRRERDNLAEAYRTLGERKHKNELAESRMDMELKASADRIWEEYELTYENAQTLRHDIAVGATQQRVNGLKAEIRELGDINVSAIEDYRTVSERYETLGAQYADLEKAKSDLYTLIGQLTKTMEQTFVAEFQKIQENFSETFTELFGGGHAELRLSDKNDVLNCDIDIIAQPPGKKLQLLSLLSGGERALTAIALLFAMLKLKAPAFCVLDEIETSLDEANVSKFANYLRDYSAETQFIIITHRKGSMEVCDTLYGVAMEEKGISSIVSAKFGETS
ncbi:MAG: chromosome segregation protein SMC [Clostridia bacterium]|nr:chromosome segregation protein SMC [Clostridia bacterium]